MFYGAYNFNQPMESWDDSKVTAMSYMFGGGGHVSNFNQPIVSRDVSKVEDISAMFYDASEFNQCLSTWVDKTPNDADTEEMFELSDCPLHADPASNVGPWCKDSDICLASEPQGPCTNSEEEFNTSKKKSTTCKIKNGKRKKFCKKKVALKSCPGICNIKCTCKDKKTFKFNKKKYRCKKVNKNGQPQCNDTTNKRNKVSNLCPKKCGTFYETE